MISAFGIEHTISKSFVGGKFVRAVDLSAKQASKVKTGGQWKKAKGTSLKDQQFRTMMTSPEVKEFAQNPGVKVDRALPKSYAAAGTIRFGSKSSGHGVVAGQSGSKKLADKISIHEAHHAGPKRSSYRLHSQIMNNPKKLFREEARADWHAAGHYGNAKNADSVYAGMARAAKGIKRGKAHEPAKLNPVERKQVKAMSRINPEARTATNREYLRNNARAVNANTPQYALHTDKKQMKTANAYRKLQDDFKRRGVRRQP